MMEKFLRGKSSGVLEGLLAYDKAFDKLVENGYIAIFFGNELCIFKEEGSGDEPAFKMNTKTGEVILCSDPVLESILRGL